MGLYRRDNSSNWQMCFFVNGKKVRMSAKTTNKKVAQRIYDKLKGQVAEGTFKLNSKHDLPFDRLLDEFLETHSRVEKKSYQCDVYMSKSLRSYFGSKPISGITAYDVKSWRKWRADQVSVRGTKISKASVNRELALLKTMFNLAVEWGWMSENPAGRLRFFKGENKRLRFLNQEEIRRLLDSASSWLRPILITAISTGMRKGEILNLKWADVDFERGFIRVEKSKNSESRDIPMSEHLSGVFRQLKNRGDLGSYVFCRADGGKRKGLYEAFESARRKAGLEDFRFHDLRHTAASLFAAGGCDIITLQHLLGHKSISMTQRYAHLMPEKHLKTRQIIEDFWQGFGVTHRATPPHEHPLINRPKRLSPEDIRAHSQQAIN